MPTRQANIDKRKRALLDAFARLKDGNPERVESGSKISPSKVEDEAGVPRSTLYGKPYVSLLRDIQEYKGDKKAEERGLSGEIELLKAELRESRKEVTKQKDECKRETQLRANLEQEFLDVTGKQLDFLKRIIDELPATKRKSFTDALDTVTEVPLGVSNIVPIKKR
jgi:hypothetical protein